MFMSIWLLLSFDLKLPHPYIYPNSPHTNSGGDSMASYVAPAIRDKFESLSINLKNCILERDVRLENIHDLIHVLEDIVKDGEAE